MTFIEPFELETWLVNVFSGDPNIFFGISLLCLVGMSAYFRMSTLAMFFMIGIFVITFSALSIAPISYVTFFIILAGLIIGLVVNKFFNRQ